jgi:hypothetical protein
MQKSAPIKLLAVVAIAIAALSCRSSRTITEPAADFQTFTSDLKFIYKPADGSKTTTVNGQLGIIRDRLIRISLRAPIINSEVARITITPDRFIMLDRFGKTFIDEPPEKLRYLLHKDYSFHDLQKLFTTDPETKDKDGDRRTVTIAENDFFAEFILTDMTFDSEVNPDISIPEKYRKIDVEQLIKSQFSTQ